MWCPACGAEYRQGYFICADCGCPLVEELETQQEDPCVQEIPPEKYSFLTTVSSEIEAGALEALLVQNKIPVLKKYPGCSEYLKVYMGMVNSGVKLYVPEIQVELAKKMISERLSVGRQMDEETPVEGRRTFSPRKKTVITRIIFVCYILPLLVQLVIALGKRAVN